MPISSVTNRVVFNGDGSSAVFNFAFEFHATSDLAVFIHNSSRTEVVAPKVLTADYTVDGNIDFQGRFITGANVTFNSSPATGDKIIIFRSSVITSTYDLSQNGTISSQAIVKHLDYLTLQSQRANDQATRSIRLADGFPDAFDTALPPTLIKNAPLIINSSGLAMGLGVVSVASSGVATAFFGILPVANGGTGANISPTAFGVLFADSITTMDTTASGTDGDVLHGNGSSAPTFKPVSFNSSNFEGILKVGVGGTGTGTSYIQYGVMFASSATQMANTDVGGVAQILIGNGSSAPSFQSLDLAGGSSFINTLRVVNGGTGNSAFTQSRILFASSATQIAGIDPSTSGFLLTSNGSSAPTFKDMASNTETQSTIADNQSSHVSIASMDADSNDIIYKEFRYSILRNDGGADIRRESGSIEIEFKTASSIWVIASRRASEDALNIASSLIIFNTSTVGTIQYKSDLMNGTSYVGTMRWKAPVTINKEV